MTTKSKRNLPLDDEPEYTFGKFKPTTRAPKGSPEEGKTWGLDDATPEEWNTVAAKLYHPADIPAGFKPDEYIIRNGVKVWTKDPDETAQAAREIEQALQSCPVERPDHYNTGAIEAIEAIRASMDADQYFGYLKGNVMKYLWRYDYKEKPVEDLRKADWYLNRLIDALIEDNQ